MATQICNIVTVNLDSFSNATAAANRTYTATRQLRMYDLKTFQTNDPAPGVNTLTVSNGANVCITMVSGAAPAADDVARLGQNAADTVDDAQMLVAAGGTCVFATDDAALIQAFLYCYPL